MGNIFGNEYQLDSEKQQKKIRDLLDIENENLFSAVRFNQLVTIGQTDNLPGSVDHLLRGLRKWASVRDSTVLNLINWRTIEPVPIPTFIIGPSTLTMHVYGNYTYYVFGEYHSRITSCKIPAEFIGTRKFINSFLETVTRNSPVFIDLFLEYPHDYNKRRSLDTFVQDIMNSFQSCIGEKKIITKKCLPNLRVHGVSDRPVAWENCTGTVFYYSNFNTAEQNKRIELDTRINTCHGKLKAETPIKIAGIHAELDALSNLNTGEDLLDYIRRFFHWEKESYHNRLPIVDTLLKKKLAESSFMNMIHNIKLYFQINPIRTDYYEPDLNSLARLLVMNNAGGLFDVGVMVMDVYTIGRALKFYAPRSVVLDAFELDPVRAYNVIMYGGDTHAITYRSILCDMGFIETQLTVPHTGTMTRATQRCVQIKPEFMNHTMFNIPSYKSVTTKPGRGSGDI